MRKNLEYATTNPTLIELIIRLWCGRGANIYRDFIQSTENDIIFEVQISKYKGAMLGHKTHPYRVQDEGRLMLILSSLSLTCSLNVKLIEQSWKRLGLQEKLME
jgi:hypothetical protein